MQGSSAISLSPSFNTYSNSTMAEIAARVVEELASDEFDDDEFYFEREDNSPPRRSEAVADDGEEEFEFAFVTRDSELPSPISADEIFSNGQIRPVYPLFNGDLFLESMEFHRGINGDEADDREKKKKVPTIRLPLRKLFSEERETSMTASSCSSSEGDDLDGIPADSYCVWRPKEEDGRCKKSSSTGSNSKRWKFKDLLHRSHSDGSKDDFVILSPSKSGGKEQNEVIRGKVTPVTSGKVKSAAAPPLPPLYSRDGGEKRRSYLPYRQDLVGFFANVNGLSKNLQPF